MRIGTDIQEISRIKQALQRQPQFVERVLTIEELAVYRTLPQKRQVEYLTGRFCAKEAYAKALKIGLGNGFWFTDIVILNDVHGAPYIARAPLKEGVILSISHSHNYATAVVLIEATETQIVECLKTIGIMND